MTNMYFWKDNQVVVTPELLYSAIHNNLLGIYCVDDAYSSNHSRYGMFMYGIGWKHLPLSTFPKEFKVHLLLLGVPLTDDGGGEENADE